MKWKDLSNDAKNILEMVDPPYGIRPKFLKIEKNKEFTPFSVNVFVTEPLFQEICEYATKGDYVSVVEQTEDYILVKFKKYIKGENSNE